MERKEILNIWTECLNGEVFEKVVKNKNFFDIPNSCVIGIRNHYNFEVIIELDLNGTRMDGPLKLKGEEEIIFNVPIILNNLTYHFIQQNNLEEIPETQTILYVTLKDEFKNIFGNNRFLCFDDKNKNIYFYKDGCVGLAFTRETPPESEIRIQAFNKIKNKGYIINENEIILPSRS